MQQRIANMNGKKERVFSCFSFFLFIEGNKKMEEKQKRKNNNWIRMKERKK